LRGGGGGARQMLLPAHHQAPIDAHGLEQREIHPGILDVLNGGIFRRTSQLVEPFKASRPPGGRAIK
jgi:hypothetical protein